MKRFVWHDKGTVCIAVIIASSWDNHHVTETAAGPGACEDFMDSAATFGRNPTWMDIIQPAKC